MKLNEIIGVIFDFNGTMFFDSQKHIEAWKLYIEEITGLELTQKNVERYIVNKSGKSIIEHYLGYEVNDEILEQLTEEKESIYRRLCKEDKNTLALAPGLEQFLDYLTDNNIPITIATTANMSNVMFYFEQFDLYKWFDPEKVVYKTKRIKDKPFPDMYLVACKMINLHPSRCLVFEDSVTGITAAVNAGIKNIVAINGDNKMLSVDGFDNVRFVIEDYTALGENLLEYKV